MDMRRECGRSSALVFCRFAGWSLGPWTGLSSGFAGQVSAGRAQLSRVYLIDRPPEAMELLPGFL